MSPDGALLTIASNPPLGTSGQRTMGRVALAAKVLGYSEARLANLFALPTYRTGDLSTVGATADGWLQARPLLQEGLTSAGAVLLAYGKQAPSGSARQHFRDQVAWMDEQIALAGLPVWWVGGEARHPSRWQRYSAKHHPDVPFTDALKLVLVPRT
ncbi:Putative uncharacterized protein [Propionibacterium freudenreichii]|uniref:DUF1643 domain-containing protein n=1 Tax=Propionibacterium freudenreichii TaxID=1744 RepID=UPI0005423D55|nr:DUF1643 domain-containing protein [Propionibacterium freudenreichii]CEH10549.1 Putative uncharacterized protein [Propionibacterium freudenreichii]SBW75832.1 Hypothetical protein PFR_JS22-1_184 [Propionibacterium freudenreichii]